jgi:hypothetical protein
MSDDDFPESFQQPTMNHRSSCFRAAFLVLLSAVALVATIEVLSAQEITDLGESVILPACHYKLDESSGAIVREARGDGPDGSIQTDLGKLAVEGVRGGAIRFDGESAVVIPDGPALDLGRDGFTLSLFARRPDEAASEHDNERVLAKIPGEAGGGGYDFTFGREAIAVRFYSGDEIVGQVGYHGSRLVDRWLHMAVVMDRSGVGKLYLNGRQVGQTRIDRVEHPDLANASPLLIGGRRVSGEHISQPFTGWIDDLRIYQIALNPDQILTLAGPLSGEALTRREAPRIDFVSDKPLHQLARSRLKPRGMPPYSAVCIRNLRVNPYKFWETDAPLQEKIESLYRSEGSGFEKGTLWSMQAFHANKLEWTYRMNPHFAREARKIAFSVGGAMSGGTSIEAAAALDVDGEPQPRGHGSRDYLGCANRSAYRKHQLDRAVKVIEKGADALQHDEAGLESTWRCYCDECVNGFPAWLKRNASADALTELGIAEVSSFDYRAFVRAGKGSPESRELWIQYKNETIRDYHIHLRDGLRKRLPHFSAYTANNSSFQQYDVRYEPFDYFMSELMFTSCDPVRLFQRHEVILQAGKALICHPPKANSAEPMEYMKPLTRAVIGHAYAMGGWLAAPYDLFIGTGIPRYFGKPEDYADLYGFIRANAEYLDGFERAAYAGAWLGDQTAGNVLLIEGGSGGVYAFARTRPDQPEAPIVIHLVDWGEELEFVEGRFRDQAGFNSVSYKRGGKAPFKLEVRMANCYGDRSFAARLLTPPLYNKQTHWQAERTGDYSALRESRPIEFQAQGEYAAFRIPKLQPYALLVLEPDEDR